jgi:hypothetical protein
LSTVPRSQSNNLGAGSPGRFSDDRERGEGESRRELIPAIG